MYAAELVSEVVSCSMFAGTNASTCAAFHRYVPLLREIYRCDLLCLLHNVMRYLVLYAMPGEYSRQHQCVHATSTAQHCQRLMR